MKTLHHEHKVDIPTHSHRIEVRSHTHSIEIRDHTHSVEIRSHTHSIEIKSHTHNIEYGIFHGGRADKCYLKVDGKTVYNYNQEVDLIPYLSKDGGGKIQRGTWHTVEIVPDKLTRINASLFIQLFTTSRGGGDY